MSIKEFESDV